MTEGKPLRHHYPIWLSWPLEIVAFLLAGVALWAYLRTGLQVLFQQWPQGLANLGAIPYAQPIALLISGPVPPGPVPWEDLYPALVGINARGFLLFFLAATLRNFLPALRLREKGLQVRRGLGWATIPWERVTQVHNMTLADERMVLFIQGRRWTLGPWFRLYSLLWGGNLKKGFAVVWHISDFESLAGGLVTYLQEVYGEDQLEEVVDDEAYSLLYALIFLPRPTWKTLSAPREERTADTFTHPRWVRLIQQPIMVLLLLLAIWRYAGVWWRFLVGNFPGLLGLLRWPVLGTILGLYGAPNPDLFDRFNPNLTPISWPSIALLLGQVSIIMSLVAFTLLQGLLPDWQVTTDGAAASFRKRWLQIPWGAIRSIRESILAPGRGIILVQVKWPRLTFWHTLYSLLYGAGLRRGVMFTSLLPGFEELRQRIHLGVIRAHEKDAKPPKRPILEENGASDMLLMAFAPPATLRRWGGQAEPEKEDREIGGRLGSLLKGPGLSAAAADEELPWEKQELQRGWPSIEEPFEAAPQDKFLVLSLLRSILPLVLMPVLLVLLEELLFPPLTRTLAVWSVPSSLPLGGLPHLLALATAMAVLALGEAPLLAMLISVVAEMYNQPGDFLRALSYYPRTQSPRTLLGLIVIGIGATGIVQPLFLLWWLAGLIWGGILNYLAARELLGWRGAGSLLLPGGYALYQVLVLIFYLLLH